MRFQNRIARPAAALSRGLCIVSLLLAPHAWGVELARTQRFDIAAQPLATALIRFAQQSNLQVVTAGQKVEGVRSPGVAGKHSLGDALKRLLDGTGFTYRAVGEGTITIAAAEAPVGRSTEVEATRLAQVVTESPRVATGQQVAADTAPAGQGIPEILVEGSRVLNTDIPRSRDDAQPYVIFDRRTLETSGASNLNEFLSQRLTMNTAAARSEQTASQLGTLSSINLRGLGAEQTLVLVDGHRIASASNSTPLQANLNGIPVAAVERIEVLPTTASGIYGGGATGGVVNVILRRGYSGVELKTSYENGFGANAPIRRVDIASGFSLEEGRTDVLVMGSYSDSGMLTLGQTAFFGRARTRILANNPAFYYSSFDPPLGATPNIRSIDGSGLFGPGTAAYTSVAPGYAGGGGLAPLQSNAGRYNLDPARTVQNPGGSGSHLLKDSSMKAVSATLRRQFAARVDAFLEFSASEGDSRYPTVVGLRSYTLAADAPNNPFGRAVRVTPPLAGAGTDSSAANDDRRMMGGVIVRLPRRWLAEADYTWSRSSLFVYEPRLVFGAIGAIQGGTLDVLRDTVAYPLDFAPYLSPRASNGPHRSTLKDVTLRFAGPVTRTAAGDVMASVMLEHRDEILARSRFNGGYFPGKSQAVDSLYMELKVPLFRRGRAEPALEFQVAGRYDDYAVTGATGYVFDGSGAPVERMTANTHSANPMVGMRYQPFDDLMFRASWGTGFLPPSVSQIFPNPPGTEMSSDGIDPLRGNTPAGPYVTVYGGNPALTPEESESFSIGAVLTPRLLPGLRVSLDFSRIDKTDNITELTPQQLIDNENILGGRVVRGQRLPGDPAGWAGPIELLDASLLNISEAQVQVYDVALDYSLPRMLGGSLDFHAMTTWQAHYRTRIVPTLPVQENVGITSASPLKFKANAGVNWARGAWSLGWNSRYYDSYQVAANALSAGALIVANQGGLRVASQLYHDVFASYRFDAGGREPSRLLGGVEAQLSVKNVFNSLPPFDAGSSTASPYYYSAFGDPRGAIYHVSLKKIF